MPGPWDDVVKELLRKSPKQFAEWLIAEGLFVAALSVELTEVRDARRHSTRYLGLPGNYGRGT